MLIEVARPSLTCSHMSLTALRTDDESVSGVSSLMLRPKDKGKKS